MIRHSLVRAAAVAGALLLVVPGAVAAAGPQPDPPAFGMFGITAFQRAHLHLALPAANTRPAINTALPCTVDAGFVDENGKTVAENRFVLKPGQAVTHVFTPGRDDNPAPTLAAAAPVRQQLRALIAPVGDRTEQEACAALVATAQVDNGNGVPTLTVSPVVSPRDAASGLPTGKRQHKPFVVTAGPLAIGVGHTARLNVLHAGPGAGPHCTFLWAFVDETGARTEGAGEVGGGQAVHADFTHTDQTRGLALIRAEVTVNEPDHGSCPSDPGPIVTLEGFDSTLGHSHSIVPAQSVLPAVQLPAVQ